MREEAEDRIDELMEENAKLLTVNSSRNQRKNKGLEPPKLPIVVSLDEIEIKDINRS